MSAYVRFASLPSADLIDIVGVNPTVDTTLAVGFDSASGKFKLCGVDGVDPVLGPVLVTDKWYLVDVIIDMSANPHVIRACIDNGTEVSGTRASAADTVSTMRFGTTTTTANFDIYIDDAIASQTVSDYPLGEHRIHKLSPNADGSHNITTSGDFDDIGTAFDNTTTDSWTRIDDVPLDSTITSGNIIRQELGTTSNYMEHLWEDIPVTGETAYEIPVDIWGNAMSTDAAAGGTSLAVFEFLLANDTPVTPDVRLSTDDPNTVVFMFDKKLDRPSGGWDRGTLNAIKSRWGFSDGTPDAYLCGAMLEIAMFPGPPFDDFTFPTPELDPADELTTTTVTMSFVTWIS